MIAILPNVDMDAFEASAYFMPYQQAWILDDSQMRLAEKSVRIGWTYADAFKNVRKRLNHPNRDYLFSTKDQPTAIEFVETCYKFVEVFERVRSVLSRGVETWQVPVFDENGKATKFTEDLKVGYIKFDNGSRILAFSSNPNALRAFGGDVGLDEFAFHPAAEALWASASGRITWGYDIGVWSSHNGDATLFHDFVRDAQAGVGGWSYYRVTMEAAIELGLVEKINERSGATKSREAFLEDCRNRARLPEVYEQEYNCNPKGGTAAIVPWEAIARCQSDYTEYERLHLEAKQVTDLVGEFRPEQQFHRETRIAALLQQAFPALVGRVARHSLGFDVAASGEGDLASIYIDQLTDGQQVMRGLFTCRTDDWHFLETVLFWFLRRVTAVKAAGDETGLGRQICWAAAKRFPGVFEAVNFASKKSDMGFALMNQLTMAEKRFPRAEKDIAADYYAIRKSYSGKKWIFTSGKNAYNPVSHGDIAWAGALSTEAAAQATPPTMPIAFSHAGHRMRAKRERSAQ